MKTVPAAHLALTLVAIAVLLQPLDSQPATMQRVAGTRKRVTWNPER